MTARVLRPPGGFRASRPTPTPVPSFASPRPRPMLSVVAEAIHAAILAAGKTVELRELELDAVLKDRSAEQVQELRAEYILKYGNDPELSIRRDDFVTARRRLDRAGELRLVGALNRAQVDSLASVVDALRLAAAEGPLSPSDREAYLATLPLWGIWAPPVRATATGAMVDSLERSVLKAALARRGGVELDLALAAVEAQLPPPPPLADAPRGSSVAVLVSSVAAQWQELVGFASEMTLRGHRLTLFTPRGRPAGFQRDSLLVNARTCRVGFGAPPELDPSGPAGDLARTLLSSVRPVAELDVARFGALYVVGGLGFNDDVVHATPVRRGGLVHARLEVDPEVASMMAAVVAARLPVAAVGYGATLLAATRPDGHSLLHRLRAATIPAHEAFVGALGHREPMFSFDLHCHRALADAGAETSMSLDAARGGRVVVDHDRLRDLILVTGPGPLAAAPVAAALDEAMRHRWRASP